VQATESWGELLDIRRIKILFSIYGIGVRSLERLGYAVSWRTAEYCFDIIACLMCCLLTH